MLKVSVIVPNYNHALFLVQRIESILNQTFQDFEVIILDDCSTDNSKKIIEKYRTHPKVSKIIYNDVNSGNTFKQWNKGIEQAKGEWIWIAESDDVADVSLLENLIHLAEQDENIVLSYCQSYKINAEGKIIGNWIDWTQELDENLFKHNFTFEGMEFIKKYLLTNNTIPNASAVIFKRDNFNSVGKADIDVPYCADWLLWMKILTTGKITFHAEPLNYFRKHENSVISKITNSSELFVFKYNIILLAKFIEFLKKKNLEKKKELIQIFKKQLSIDSEFEIKLLIRKSTNIKNLRYCLHLIKYVKDKTKIVFFITIKTIKAVITFKKNK